MANITLSVSDDLHKKMKEFSEVKWSEVARKAIQERINALELAESLASKSKLTQKDIDEFSDKMKHLATRKFVK